MIDSITWISQYVMEADRWLLLAINGAHTPGLDAIMWAITGKWVWLPFYLLLVCAVWRHKDRRSAVLFLFAVALCIMLADVTCGQILRGPIGRLRPSNPENPISQYIHLVNNYHGGSYGFPSCHAANSFGLAMLIALYFRRRSVTLIILAWSALQCYSRMYLGVHYPTDILAGILFGGSYAMICWQFTEYHREMPVRELKSHRLVWGWERTALQSGHV